MAQNSSTDPKLAGDGAKRVPGEDEFGLRVFAETLGAVVRSRIAAQGYAIGLEGEWGSGKTTVLNFLEHELKSNPELDQSVIRFEPWLVGRKAELLRQYFKELSGGIRTLTSAPAIASKLQEQPNLVAGLIARLNEYSELLSSGVSALDSAAALDPTWHGKAAALIGRVFLSLVRALSKPVASLESLKEEIVGDLQMLEKLLPSTRFTVLIDDTDRLDPEESVEILRLVKAVANFPLVTYVVGFDRNIMSAQVRQVVKVGTGEDYIEKIFQQLVPLPPQEPFALRRFVRAKLAESFPEEMKIPDSADLDKLGRHDSLFDKWFGVLLKTPRDAIRVCEAVKFGWPYLQDKADFLDFVWLQLLKLKCRDLYAWTESYVANIGGYRDDGRPGDEEATQLAAQLKNILDRFGWSKAPYKSGMDLFLPGLRSVFLEGKKSVAFKFESSDELAKFEGERRLGSPSHWRLYFAFEVPSYVLDDAELDRLQKVAADDPSGAEQILRELARRDHQVPGHFLDVALDRFRDRAERLSPAEQIGLARSFAEVMDEVPRGTYAQFRGDDPWRRASQILGPAVAPRWKEIVETGSSINWLCYVMRDLGFVLGIINPARSAPDRQWLSRTQFAAALDALLNRLRELGLEAIFAKPEPLVILYCWRLLGDIEELRQLMAKAAESDKGLVNALMAIQTGVDSSDRGYYRALQESVVGEFFEPDEIKNRLVRITQSSSTDAALQNAASQLLSAWSVR